MSPTDKCTCGHTRLSHLPGGRRCAASDQCSCPQFTGIAINPRASHRWLPVAQERILAGEAEVEVMADYGYAPIIPAPSGGDTAGLTPAMEGAGLKSGETPGRPGLKWWCCQADYGEHETTCKNHSDHDGMAEQEDAPENGEGVLAPSVAGSNPAPVKPQPPESRCYECGRTPERGHDEDCTEGARYGSSDPFIVGIAEPADETIERLEAERDQVASKVQILRDALGNQCGFYCTWYDQGTPSMAGNEVAYALIGFARQALAATDDKKSKPSG